MIKKVVVTLLVEVDTEDEDICPSGDPLMENSILNVLEDRFFENPVSVLDVYYKTNDPNIDHLITLFRDAHWRSLDSICSHPLKAEDIEDLAEGLGYDSLAEALKDDRLDNR